MTEEDFNSLVKLMEHMRSPEGCAWDREQNLDSFKKHLAEEAEEAVQALENNDFENLKEELGDILWNILFISQIAKEEGRFDIYDVMRELKEKIVRRHPHVFGKEKAQTADEVMIHYRKAKEAEKSGKFNKRGGD